MTTADNPIWTGEILQGPILETRAKAAKDEKRKKSRDKLSR